MTPPVHGKELGLPRSPESPPPITASLLADLARLVEVELGPERAAALVAQAEPHFGLMRVVHGLDPRGAEAAHEFRLDRQESGK